MKERDMAVANGFSKLSDAHELARGAAAIREFLPMIEGQDEEGQLPEGSARGVKHVLAAIDARVLDLLTEAEEELLNAANPAALTAAALVEITGKEE
ncbi:MAG: hypothetical protein FJ253_08860 [Phycisphaerae bacterium]|nr:hypothetical protein [Phycisphaerae bacterium]